MQVVARRPNVACGERRGMIEIIHDLIEVIFQMYPPSR
jgi:hypothetical protein